MVLLGVFFLVFGRQTITESRERTDRENNRTSRFTTAALGVGRRELEGVAVGLLELVLRGGDLLEHALVELSVGALEVEELGRRRGDGGLGGGRLELDGQRRRVRRRGLGLDEAGVDGVVERRHLGVDELGVDGVLGGDGGHRVLGYLESVWEVGKCSTKYVPSIDAEDERKRKTNQ
jgi:hypothetical protein